MPTSAESMAVSMVESTAEAAFASDERGCIIAWNRAAEVLFGVSVDQALDRRCHEMLSGCDVLGALYCRADCALREMVCRREPVRSFTLDVRRASGEVIRVDLLVFVLREGPELGEHATPRSDDTTESPQTLTRREVEILRLLSGGAARRRSRARCASA